jgi:hypothetical protein
MGDESVFPQASMDHESSERGQEYDLELLNAIPNGTIFAYNLSDQETPGGMKVRWKFRVATGPETARADTRQAQAIQEALTWLRTHPAAMTRP